MTCWQHAVNNTGKRFKVEYNISVWDQYKLNYWAIPKCANTAIKVALSGFDADPEKPGSKVKWVHNPNNVKYVDQETALSNGYRNFTVIRHPYDRVISLYKDFGLRRPWFESNPTLNSFIDQAQKRIDPHTRSITDYLYNNNQLLVDEVIMLDNASEYLKQYGLKLKVFNKTNNLTVNLTNSQKQKIFDWYAQDFDKFGFER